MLAGVWSPDPRGSQFPPPLVLQPGVVASVPLIAPACAVSAVHLDIRQAADQPGTAIHVTDGSESHPYLHVTDGSDSRQHLHATLRGLRAEAARAGAHVAVVRSGSDSSVRVPLHNVEGPASLLLELTWRPDSDAAAPLPIAGVSLQRHEDGALSGLRLLPCVFAGGSTHMTSWLVAVLIFLAATMTLVALIVWPIAGTSRAWTLVPALLAASATAMFILVVPPGEGPDELAHLQYTRFVGKTGALPQRVPAEDSPWRDASYEWVQHPTYYIVSGAIARVLGLVDEPPALAANPESKLRGGHQVAMYLHGPRAEADRAIVLIWLLRALHVVLAGATAWWVAGLLRACGAGPRLAIVGAAGMGLVPQVAALMGHLSTDGAATAAAALAALAIARITTDGSRVRSGFAAGAATGLALALKLSAAFLLPMLAVAVASTPSHAWSVRLRRAGWALAGVAIVSAWVPLRELIVFGDPLGRSFRQAMLTIAGLGPTPSPGLLDPALLSVWRTNVFEPFWARFGSLGAGPFPGSRLWTLYAMITAGLLVALAYGAGTALRAPRRHRALLAATVGAACAGLLWFYVTLAPRPYMAIHWTPRYVQPALPLVVAITAIGAQQLLASARVPATVARLLAAATLVVLAAASLAVLRAVILQFHFGY